MYMDNSFCTGCKKNKKETVTFFVEEMDCQNCIKKIEKGIAFEKGVTDLRCDLSTRTAKVTYKTDKTDCEKLCSAFKKIGLDVVPLEENSDRPAEKNMITDTHINMIISKSALYLQSLLCREAFLVWKKNIFLLLCSVSI